MPARRRELKPDSKGRYRPYLGFRVDAESNRKEHRFNLGTDKREAERRMARLYDLHDESEAIWTNLAVYNLNLWMHTLVELWAWDRPKDERLVAVEKFVHNFAATPVLADDALPQRPVGFALGIFHPAKVGP